MWTRTTPKSLGKVIQKAGKEAEEKTITDKMQFFCSRNLTEPCTTDAWNQAEISLLLLQSWMANQARSGPRVPSDDYGEIEEEQ